MAANAASVNVASVNVTSVDVAAEAGVSQATVARTFSSPHMVSEATRQRVHDAAQQLGYVPNAIARSLKSQRTNIVGAVVPAYGEYWQSVVTEFSRRLTERSRQLLLFSFSEADQVESMLRAVQQYRLDGLVLASAAIEYDQLSSMAATSMPLVAFNQPAAAGVVNSVSVDNELGMSEVADHVADLGCRSAVFVGGLSATSTDRVRFGAASARLQHHGIACRYVEAGAFSYEAGYKTGCHLAGDLVGSASDESERPDAVIVAGDELALGVVDGLKSYGVDVPGDVVLTGFDGLPQAAWDGYDLTTIVQPIPLLVAEAVDILLPSDTKLKNSTKPVERVVPGVLRPGRTTRP